VAGIGHERQGVCGAAIDKFGDYEAEIQRDPDRKGATKMCRRVRM
jgi:hypothetical protein